MNFSQGFMSEYLAYAESFLKPWLYLPFTMKCVVKLSLTITFPSSRFDFCSECTSTNSDCANRVSIPDTKDKINSDKAVPNYHAETLVKQSGLAHGVVMWWTLDMDIAGDITLTTAPRWAHPDGNDCQVLIFLKDC